MEHLNMEFDVFRGQVEDALVKMNQSRLASKDDFEKLITEMYWDGFSIFETCIDLCFTYGVSDEEE